MEQSAEGLDLALLLAPIPGDNPAGSDLRRDGSPQSLYFRLRDARAEARAAERAMESEERESAPPPQWRQIRALAEEALRTAAKDLEIAGWLTEALLRSDGLKGMAFGVRVMTGLVEGFWEGLSPLPDEDGISSRLAPLAALNGVEGNGTLIQPLRRLPLFSRADGAAFQLWQYQQSCELLTVVDEARRQQRLAAGIVPFETVESEARLAGGRHFAELRQEAAAAAEAWQALGEALERRAGADAPPAGRVSELLQEIGGIAERFAEPEKKAAAREAETPLPAPAAFSAALPAGGIGSREEALATLAAIADFFRRTEPLSPLAYTLQEAVRRAHLSWPQLLEEIVPDETARAAILTSLGIKPPSQ